MRASAPSSGPTRRVAELDALRGLSALAVGLYHLTFFVPFMVPGIRGTAASAWWGCYGVQVFFAISGFVILGTLERTADLRRFADARARRLIPEYWAAMAVTALVAALFGPERLRVDLLTWLENLPMMQLWTGVRMVDGVYWSLNVEIGFYAAMALAWYLGWTRRVEALALGWLAAKWLLWAIAAPAWLNLLLITEQAPYFIVGLVGYRVWTGERSWSEQVPVLGVTGVTVWLLDPVHAHWLFAGLAPGFLLLATGRLKWLAQPPLLWMGWVSYPFYLLHAVIGYSVMARLQGAGVSPAWSVAAALAVAGLLATGMAAAFDRGRAITARRSRSGRAGPASAAPAASGI